MKSRQRKEHAMDGGPIAPLILQRADPHIYRHTDGWYYFTASVPEYDRVVVRRARSIAALADAAEVTVWQKPAGGPLSDLIWAPEIHHRFGAWRIYFAAAPSREIKDRLFQHRIYVISNPADNPQSGGWSEPLRVDTGLDTFSLDATTFEHRGKVYMVWAQKDPGIAGNSNLYIARLRAASELDTGPVRLSVPELDWEVRGFLVNEGPAVLIRHGRVFLAYSASATDENYCVGLLHASEDADLLDASSWTKLTEPVFQTDREFRIYGPGHNSFTVSEDGAQDIIVYHARTYTDIQGDPLWDPNRHTFFKPLRWSEQGMPVFGRPSGVEC